MSRVFAFAVLLVACTAPSSAQPADLVSPEHRVAPDDTASFVGPLLATLRAQAPLFATFDERRYYAFRKDATEFSGELRLDPQHGLSLRYLTPEERLLVVDTEGAFMADARGRRRNVPDDPRAQAATRLLLDVLRFDLAKLSAHFDLYAAQDSADAWRLAFIPKSDVKPADAFQPLFIHGEGPRVTSLELRRADSQRVRITIRETRSGAAFSSEELARYFR